MRAARPRRPADPVHGLVHGPGLRGPPLAVGAAFGLVLAAWTLAHVLAVGPGTAAARVVSPPADPSPSAAADSVLVLVVYHSLTGHTEELARAAAEGARQVPGATVVLASVDEVTETELRAADGLIVGSPTHWANVSAPIKAFLDGWPDMVDKVGGALATGGGSGGGHEHVILSLVAAMLNHGMVVVGPVFEEDGFRFGWMGAGAVTAGGEPALSEGELEGARRLGQRVAQVALSRRAAFAP